MRRFGLKTGVRTVAIALIAFPEPVTTVIGALMLGASFAVFREKSLSKFGDLDALIERSFQIQEKPVGFRRYLMAKQAMVKHNLKPNSPSGFEVAAGNQDISPINPQYHDWFDNRKVSSEVIHHTLKTSFPQYEAVPAAESNSNIKISNTKPAIEYHKLKTSIYPKTAVDNTPSHQPKQVNLDPQQIMHHTLRVN